MAQNTNVENLIINKLTRAQYESIASPDPTQLYFITDEVISSADVISALGYTPYNTTNPAGYTSNIGTVTSVNNTQPDANGNVTLTIPDSATWGNITGTLSNQTDLQNALDAKQSTISDLSTIRSGASLGATALQPNDNITELVNNAGYITGITSSDVTTALGYTPYNSSNPNGYTSNVGTVTSVNNVQPVNGNVTLTIPDTSNLANKDLSNLSSTGNAKFQAPLVSGTNIKTLNGNSILGSGDLTLDGLPSQTGQSGKFLTTDGTDASWATVTIPTPTYDSTNERITW